MTGEVGFSVVFYTSGKEGEGGYGAHPFVTYLAAAAQSVDIDHAWQPLSRSSPHRLLLLHQPPCGETAVPTSGSSSLEVTTHWIALCSSTNEVFARYRAYIKDRGMLCTLFANFPSLSMHTDTTTPKHTQTHKGQNTQIHTNTQHKHTRKHTQVHTN